MRLGLVIYGNLDTVSGGYLYDRRLVEHLRRAGDTVEVVSLPWRSYPRHLLDNFSPDLAYRLARMKVDLLVEDELNHPSLLRANRAWKAAGRAPVVSIVHHLRSSEQHPAALLPLYRAVERAYLRGVERFIFNSHTTRGVVEGVLGRGVDGLVATPGGDQAGSGLSVAEITARLRGRGGLRLLFIGNLIPRKGLDTLLRALRQIKGDGWTLEVVGSDMDAAYTRRVRRLAAPLGERVRFRGRLVDGALRALLERSDVLVVPSSYEGFGIVYLEGMACGLPAIGTTAGAAGEIIRDGESGYVLPPGDPAALAAALDHLARDPALLERMSLAARRRFDEFPTWEQTAANARRYMLACVEKR